MHYITLHYMQCAGKGPDGAVLHQSHYTVHAMHLASGMNYYLGPRESWLDPQRLQYLKHLTRLRQIPHIHLSEKDESAAGSPFHPVMQLEQKKKS
jgi:hypothetical protein